MSMFNDIVWNTNDEHCVSNVEKVKNHAKRFLARHKKSGMEVQTTLKKGNGIEKSTKWYSNSKKLPVFKGVSTLSRGVLKQKKSKTSIHFNGDSMNTELLFQTVHSANQLSVYGAVANWCCQFGSTEEEKGRANTTVENKILTKLKPEEVQLLVSPPKRATGNRMPERVQSFEELTCQIHLTQLWEKAFFQYPVAAGKTYKFRPNADDGWEQLLLCVENTRVLDVIRKPKLLQLFL